MSEEIEKPAADDRADDADDKVADYSTRPFAWHDSLCEETGDDADDDPREYIHGPPPDLTLPDPADGYSPAVSAARLRVRCVRRHRRRNAISDRRTRPMREDLEKNRPDEIDPEQTDDDSDDQTAGDDEEQTSTDT